MSARSVGQSQNGGSEALAGSPIRTPGDAGQAAPLEHGVDEMRRADHDAVKRTRRHVGMTAKQLQRRDDAAGHVLGGRRFDRMHDPAVLKQHRIGVGAANVDADASHANTERKSRS